MAVHQTGACRHALPGTPVRERLAGEGKGDWRDCYHGAGNIVVRAFSYNSGYLIRNRHGFVRCLQEDQISGLK
jgi:hypothetical protein